VSILADGGHHPDVTVTGGAVTLDSQISHALVGLPYRSEIETLDLAPMAGQGSARGKQKRIGGVDLDLYQFSGGEVGRLGGEMDTIPARQVGDVMNDGPPVRTEVMRLNFPGDWRKEARVGTRQVLPLPFTVRSLVARIEVTD
jgi:hypothetical protein